MHWSLKLDTLDPFFVPFELIEVFMSFAYCLFEGHNDGASWFHPSSSAAATVLQIKFHVFYLMLGNLCVVDNCRLSKGPISTPSLQLGALNCLRKSARGEM